MTGIILFGYGQMGHQIEESIKAREDVEIYRIYGSEGLIRENTKISFDRYVVIDFSHFKLHDSALDYALENKCAIVCGTTGLLEEQMTRLKKASETLPVLYSTNYSYGVLALKKILAYACRYLGDWDIELIEAHHNKKQDAPSGTAKTLLEIIDKKDLVYGREGQCPRKPGEVGVHAIRGGTEAGMHTIQFWGDNEMIEITHHAQSRRIFANGAVMAADLIPQTSGYYTFEEILDK